MVSRTGAWIAVPFILLAGAGLAAAKDAAPAATKYSVKGDQFEGCECTSVCPCIFSADATADQCRGLMGWTVKEGKYGTTNLAGLSFAAALTKSGKNLEKSMGSMEGVLFVPESATDAQRKAIEAIARAEVGAAFSKLDVKTVPIQVTGAPGSQELTVGTIAHLKVAALKGQNGQVPKIVDAPGALALPVEYCATSEIDTYNDGGITWDFAGHNSFYGPFEMKSKESGSK
jgi:hypothetical protein